MEISRLRAELARVKMARDILEKATAYFADAPMGNLKITIQDTKTVIDKMWLVERYVLS